MWIEETKSGKFKFCERYTDYVTGKQKRVSVTLDKNTPKNRKLALEILSKKAKTIQPTVPQHLTFSLLVDKYRLYQEKTVKLSTYKRNYFAANTLLNLLGEDTLVDKLSASYVIDNFIESGKEAGTLNELLTRFKAMMRWAYQNDYIDNISFLDKLVKFKDISKRDKIKNKFLEPHEISILLDKIKSTNCWHWFFFTKFLLLSGLRPGEAVALNNDDIDLVKRIIYVNKTYDSANKIITTPKTSCSIREVYIQDELLKLINDITLYSNEKRLENNKDNSCLFVNPSGNMIEYYAFCKFLRENSNLIQDKILTPHTLRHTHASLLLAEGVSVDTISRRLGHENSKITKEIYLHITEKLKQKDNEQINGINLL